MPDPVAFPSVEKWTDLDDRALLRVITHWVRSPRDAAAKGVWEAVQLHSNTDLAPRVFAMLTSLHADKRDTRDAGMWAHWIKTARSALAARPRPRVSASEPSAQPSDAPAFSWS